MGIILEKLKAGVNMDSGLIKIASPTGSGKSTNVAVLVKKMAEEKNESIGMLFEDSLINKNNKTIIFLTEKRESCQELCNEVNARVKNASKDGLLIYVKGNKDVFGENLSKIKSNLPKKFNIEEALNDCKKAYEAYNSSELSNFLSNTAKQKSVEENRTVFNTKYTALIKKSKKNFVKKLLKNTI